MDKIWNVIKVEEMEKFFAVLEIKVSTQAIILRIYSQQKLTITLAISFDPKIHQEALNITEMLALWQYIEPKFPSIREIITKESM
jgi:hypothetical protein